MWLFDEITEDEDKEEEFDGMKNIDYLPSKFIQNLYQEEVNVNHIRLLLAILTGSSSPSIQDIIKILFVLFER